MMRSEAELILTISSEVEPRRLDVALLQCPLYSSLSFCIVSLVMLFLHGHSSTSHPRCMCDRW